MISYTIDTAVDHSSPRRATMGSVLTPYTHDASNALTGPYTDEQLSGDEPIFESETRGTGTLLVRVVLDVIGKETWPLVTSEGHGHLSREGMIAVMSDIERAVHAGDRFTAWQAAQKGERAA